MRALTTAIIALTLSLPTFTSVSFADEKPIELKKATGLDKVASNCGTCHSLDYIQMNSPFMNPATWDAEVTKMIKAFGAPISDADAAAIKEYLKANYGE
jgi:mono/diheme cytochrome c family protein